MNAIMPMISTQRLIDWRLDVLILLSRGVSISEACREVGVGRATYYRHYAADPVFARQIDRARAEVQIQMLKIIRESNNWRAAAWFLEKSAPRDWGSVRDRLRLERCTCGAAGRIDER